MTTDTKRSVVVLFGGIPSPTSRKPMGDIWEWDGTTWIDKTPKTGPVGRWK